MIDPSRWDGEWYRLGRFGTSTQAHDALERHLRVWERTYPSMQLKVVLRRLDARPWHLYEKRASAKRR